MRRLIDFLAALDARAWRSVAVSFALFAAVGLVFLAGARLMGLGDPAAARAWLVAARGPWALPAAVGAFAVLAFVGAPQFVLIAAAVVAFGPVLGSIYSWVGTMVSALVGFGLGRAVGARTFGTLKSDKARRFLALIGRRGFSASLIVRLVPFAPFVVVNMAAGMAPMRLADFTAGTAIGILPKIALTAFAGGSLAAALHGGRPDSLAWLALAGAAWIGLGLVARAWLKGREREAAAK
ncbi:MAG: TVP38/TMEM64 family protein [Caulobacteraceae bacterium]